MKPLSLPKQSRLKSKKAIERLFDRNHKGNSPAETGRSALFYPLRASWTEPGERTDGYHGVKILVSVSKKKLRRAVDRVKMRRRIREAWRVSGQREALGEKDLALIYVADRLLSYRRVNDAILKIIAKLQLENNPAPTDNDAS